MDVLALQMNHSNSKVSKDNHKVCEFAEIQIYVYAILQKSLLKF
jgi:hypothetical protein